MEGVEDEDGWTTVTRHGKNKAAPRTEAHEQYLTRKARKKRQEQVRVCPSSFKWE